MYRRFILYYRKRENRMTNQNIVNSDQIHEVVRERYGTIASAAASDVKAVSCCGANDSCCDDGCGATLYDPSMLEGLPVDVSQLSLGCGDPISIASLNAGETVLDLGSGGGIDCFLAAQQAGSPG